MKKKRTTHDAHLVRMRLVEAGGQTAQDLGLSRIQGQTLVYLYLWDGECSLDQIERDLGLSKAAVSIAARQLETLGFLRRVWVKGDRRHYYRTADNLAQALREGLAGLLRRKMDQTAHVLNETFQAMHRENGPADPDWDFLQSRIKRAKNLSDRAGKLLNSRLLGYLVR